VVQRLSRDVQPPFDFAHLEHLIAQKYLLPFQEPDVTRIFPSVWRSTTMWPYRSSRASPKLRGASVVVLL
jgi:hypothetical protein